MTREEKDILLKDLSTRVPYGVIINIPSIYPYEFKAYLKAVNPERAIIYYEICESSSPLFDRNVSGVKPYLRPMSSMTNEELNEFRAFHCLYDWHPEFYAQMCNLPNIINMINWLNKKHFDYRGLIPMGLALEAPEDMYKQIV